MVEPKTALLDERGIAIVGVGLIGGSIASALRARGFTRPIVGVGRNPQRLEAAEREGLLTLGTTKFAEAAEHTSLFVFCTPVNLIAAGIRDAAALAKPGTLFTDAGSVKQSICDDLSAPLPNETHFVGSHPLAGSEKRGFEHASADLFANRVCVVTPTDSTNPQALQRTVALWEALASRIVELSPEDHDRRLALTSHLPHVAAAALAGLLDDASRPFAATGFRDTTRIAGGEPGLWTAICQANSQQLVDAVNRMQERLSEFRDCIDSGDTDRLRKLFEFAQSRRQTLDEPEPGLP